ncbi:glutathionylspermidine synthase family protein [Costertonia aggregata]|uniref:Glutathionylspermidine synthase family protein n=1 Tax=Costertonia aggregata TaxID=343403 RepID=A0A7H9ASI8_9FLAO|nr:glutathionylspermidine synthase family protein [Costertonia aggregata]QLG46451.1 glutathionylspermidine synthase family protein [Costertonia aggregata]
MVQGSRLDRLEDSRFKEVKRLKKKQLPHQLHWYLKQDYFSEELLGIHRFQIENFQRICTEAFLLFEKATQKILDEKRLNEFSIPPFFEECIYHSWNNRDKHPFLLGRFDVNGGLKNNDAKIIEFNADTCSTLPETVLWQDLQHQQLPLGNSQFNNLSHDIGEILLKLKHKISHDEPFILGSSFGYKEDILNVNTILDIGHENGFKSFYVNLEEVIFSHEEGILYEINGEYQIADIWFKMIPWDWMFTDEPQLAKDLSAIIRKDLCTVLNPAYAALWQNKKFLAYITRHFPNDYIAETFIEKPLLQEFVTKPHYGRLGENIEIKGKETTLSKGDYAHQDRVYQRFHPLEQDREEYYYQTGIFYTDKPSALNLRTQENLIITDDCEFMSHFII